MYIIIFVNFAESIVYFVIIIINVFNATMVLR